VWQRTGCLPLLDKFLTGLPLLSEQQFAWQAKFDLWWDSFFAHCMSPSKYHSCATKLVPTRKGRIVCWLSSLLGSGCAWILTIQMCLWGGYGGACISQWGENLKGRVLKKIEGPFWKAFTKENIRKAFEMTGTWPVDCSKITATQLAPAKGLSIMADPITNLTSPVKVWVHWMDALAQLGDQPTPVLELPIPSSDHPPSSAKKFKLWELWRALEYSGVHKVLFLFADVAPCKQ